MLYILSPLFIFGCWAWGCRDSDRPAVLVIACVCAVPLAPTLLLAMETGAELAEASAYALVVMTTGCCAMLLHRRSGPDDGGKGTGDDDPSPAPGGDPSPPPIDWDDFERRYWDEVQRRQRERVTA